MQCFSFESIGTAWQIDFFDNQDFQIQKREKTISQVRRVIDEFEQVFSRFLPYSQVSLMAKKHASYPQTFVFPQTAFPLFQLYEELYQFTDGFFTPFIGQSLVEAGYDDQYSLKPKILTQHPKWQEIFSYKKMGETVEVTLQGPVILDFGAAGKGYLIDLVCQVLKKAGETAFCVDAGGDMVSFNSNPHGEPLSVGLENPLNTQEAIGVAEIANQSICGSSGARRHWGGFTHIINPKTLQSPDNILSVWVVADTAFLADALTTCLFFVSGKTLKQRYNFEYLILFSDQTIEQSDHFPAKLFTQ